MDNRSDLSLFEYRETRNDTLLAQEMPYGAGSFGEIGAASLYQLDTRAPDNVFSGGVSARFEGAVYPGGVGRRERLRKLRGELSGYIPLGSPALLSLNAGGRKVWGEVPFFEAAYIGGSHTTDGLSLEPVRGGRVALESVKSRFDNVEKRCPERMVVQVDDAGHHEIAFEPLWNTSGPLKSPPSSVA